MTSRISILDAVDDLLLDLLRFTRFHAEHLHTDFDHLVTNSFWLLHELREADVEQVTNLGLRKLLHLLAPDVGTILAFMQENTR